MLGEIEVFELQIMYKQGKSLKAIAKETGYSINTVRKYAREHGSPGYKKRKTSCAQKLDNFRDYLQMRVKQAQPKWLPATVLFNEICGQGYHGSISLLRAYLATLKPEIKERPLIRFETEPGEQMQVDFAHFNLSGNNFYAFVAVLGYSRMSYVEFVTKQDIDTLIRCHENAFSYFGGIPSYGLYDNMKTIVIKRNAYGEGAHKLHSCFYDFAKHYGFIPRLCKPYNPRTKGKVERMISYLRYSFYHPLVSSNTTIDLDGLNIAVGQWLDNVANQRVHATTKVTPFCKWQVEKNHLLKIPNNYTTNYGITSDKYPTGSDYTYMHPRRTEPLQHELSVYDKLLSQGGAA